jgi:hypothetical protein
MTRVVPKGNREAGHRKPQLEDSKPTLSILLVDLAQRGLDVISDVHRG